MKKSSKLVLFFLMVAIAVFSLVGCSDKKVTLTNKTVNGISFDVPDDFKDFNKKEESTLATDEDSTASIAVSDVLDAEGMPIEGWTKDSYKELMLSSFSNVEIIEYKSDVTISNSKAIYVHYTAKNSNNVEIEGHNYLIYHPGEGDAQTCQTLAFAYNKNTDTSLKSNMEAIKNSISVK